MCGDYNCVINPDLDYYNYTYRIRPNYRTYSYKRTVKRFHSLQITGSVLFRLLLYKGVCCGYSFELHRLVDAIRMSTHNICRCNSNEYPQHMRL